MEESGHYYTVYLTSLAVGYAEDIAIQQALLAQMPDQVDFLDAGNLHFANCVPFSSAIKDFDNRDVKDATGWRTWVETVIHALPNSEDNGYPINNTSSSFQRRITLDLLRQRSPFSTDFGFLLHRLGDSFAHSIMEEESRMYTIAASCGLNPNNHGHLRHLHDPDYPFLRSDKVFFPYLKELFDLLKSKLNYVTLFKYEKKLFVYNSAAFKGKHKPLSWEELKKIFEEIFRQTDQLLIDNMLIKISNMRTEMMGDAAIFMEPDSLKINFEDSIDYEHIKAFFIREIRKACKDKIKIGMIDYEPEKHKLQTLTSFLADHPSFKDNGITIELIKKALRSLNDDMMHK